MKKAILPLMLLIIGVSLVALESAPSDVVGFVKIPCDQNFKPFSLPFTFFDGTGVETLALQDVVGPYMTGGMPWTSDVVWDMNSNTTAYEQLDGTFAGFTNFDYSHFYYMEVKNGNFDLYLAGKVEQEYIDYGTIGMSFNPVGVKAGGDIDLNEMDLVSSGFTGNAMPWLSDVLWDMTNNATATYNPLTSTWSGFTTITPGHGYYIEVKNTPFNWVYDPATRGGENNNFETQNVNKTRR